MFCEFISTQYVRIISMQSLYLKVIIQLSDISEIRFKCQSDDIFSNQFNVQDFPVWKEPKGLTLATVDTLFFNEIFNYIKYFSMNLELACVGSVYREKYVYKCT